MKAWPKFEPAPVKTKVYWQLVPNYNRKAGEPTHILVEVKSR